MNIRIILLLIFLVKNLSAQTFIPSNQRIGDTTINYVNPEFSPTGNYILWAEVDTNNGFTCKIWQCGIDPNTGDLIPSNGKGYNPFNANIYTRPADWGIDSIGPYYVGSTALGQIKFVRPTSPTSATVTNVTAPLNNKRRVFYPSQLPGINKRFVIYVLNDSINGFSSNTPQNSYYQLRLMDLDNPNNDYLIEQQNSAYPLPVPMDVIVPRWIKGSHYLTFGSADANNNVQAKEFNAFSPLSPPVFVTNDANNKIDGYPVLNPFSNQQYFMSGINATDSAYFFKRSGFGQIFIKNEVIKPTSINLQNPALNQSHEPFLFNGELYSAFQINNDGGNFFNTTLNQPGEIWMTTIDQNPQQMWLLSEFDSTLNISEPEPYIGNNKVWVYYSAVKIQPNVPLLKRQFQLRRCETPFNVTSIINENIENNYFKIFPNPVATELNIISDINEFDVRIFDSMGRLILKCNNIHKINVDSLSSGIYMMQAFFNSKSLIYKFIKN